jgi:hypothetical protein
MLHAVLCLQVSASLVRDTQGRAAVMQMLRATWPADVHACLLLQQQEQLRGCRLQALARVLSNRCLQCLLGHADVLQDILQRGPWGHRW